MLLPDLFHLCLHHLILINKLIIRNSAFSILIPPELLFFVLLSDKCRSLIVSYIMLLIESLVWIDSRLVFLCFIVSKSRFQRVEILTNNVLVVVVVCCILRRYSTLRLRVASFRNYCSVLTHYMCWWNLVIPLFFRKHVWRNLTLRVVMSAVRPLLFITYLINLGIRLLKLLLLLLELLVLLMPRKHAFNIIAGHRTWAGITVTVHIALNTIGELRAIIIMRRWQFWSYLLSAMRIT